MRKYSAASVAIIACIFLLTTHEASAAGEAVMVEFFAVTSTSTMEGINNFTDFDTKEPDVEEDESVTSPSDSTDSTDRDTTPPVVDDHRIMTSSSASSESSDSSYRDTTKTVVNEHNPVVFMAHNMDNLATDSAKGGGDYLNAMAYIMRIDVNDRGAFFRLAQDNYATLFSDESRHPADIVASLERAMQQNAQLRRYVR